MSLTEQLNPLLTLEKGFQGEEETKTQTLPCRDVLPPRRNWNFSEVTQEEITVMETNPLSLGPPKGEEILEQPQKRLAVHQQGR